MNKYRLKFSKQGKIKFVGHLDLLKIFQRAIKRAKLPISYSEGFNPHQKVSFAIPLPLGMESISEYVDIRLEENLETQEILQKLNQEMPIGLEILNVIKLENDDKNAPAIVCCGEYEVKLDIEIDNLQKKIEEILNLEEINIEKTTKKRGKESVKLVNIKNEIYNIEVIKNDTIKMLIATGSAKNLNPHILIEYIYKKLEIPYNKFKIIIKRTKLLKEKDGQFIELDL